MKIKELVEKLNPEYVNYNNTENIEIESIAVDTRKSNGTIFFAYCGESYDSNKDAEEIYNSGKVKFIICEKKIK